MESSKKGLVTPSYLSGVQLTSADILCGMNASHFPFLKLGHVLNFGLSSLKTWDCYLLAAIIFFQGK